VGTAKVKGVKCESQAATPEKKLYPCASSQLLPVKGRFKCTVSVRDRSTKAEVLVIKGRGMSLPGKITATELEVLKVGINIAMVTSKADSLKHSIFLKYPGTKSLISFFLSQCTKLQAATE